MADVKTSQEKRKGSPLPEVRSVKPKLDAKKSDSSGSESDAEFTDPPDELLSGEVCYGHVESRQLTSGKAELFDDGKLTSPTTWATTIKSPEHEIFRALEYYVRVPSSRDAYAIHSVFDRAFTLIQGAVLEAVAKNSAPLFVLPVKPMDITFPGAVFLRLAAEAAGTDLLGYQPSCAKALYAHPVKVVRHSSNSIATFDDKSTCSDDKHAVARCIIPLPSFGTCRGGHFKLAVESSNSELVPDHQGRCETLAFRPGTGFSISPVTKGARVFLICDISTENPSITPAVSHTVPPHFTAAAAVTTAPVKECAAIFGLRPATVTRWKREALGPHVTDHGKPVFMLRDKITAFVKEHGSLGFIVNGEFQHTETASKDPYDCKLLAIVNAIAKQSGLDIALVRVRVDNRHDDDRKVHVLNDQGILKANYTGIQYLAFGKPFPVVPWLPWSGVVDKTPGLEYTSIAAILFRGATA